MRLADAPFLTISPPTGLGAGDQETAAAILAEVEQVAGVVAAREAFDADMARVDRFGAAIPRFNAAAHDALARVNEAKSKLTTRLIAEFTMEAGAADDTPLVVQCSVDRERYAALNRALLQLTTVELPQAEIAKLKSEAALLQLRSDEIKARAEARLQRLTELLRTAAEAESGLTIDVPSTLSGWLLTLSENLADEANSAAALALEKTRAFERMCAQLAGSNAGGN